MRTKTLLLVAALSAAGVASSMAQVYSINTVGYVNVTVKGNGANTLVANPLDSGTNTVGNILASLPNKSRVSLWDKNTATYATVLGKALGLWQSPSTALPVGKGFFLNLTTNNAADVTLTFVGNVVPAPANSYTSSLPTVLELVGSVLPVDGQLTNATSQGPGTLNIGSTLANKSRIQYWDNSNPNIALHGFVPSDKALGSWNSNLTLRVGQGFFVKAGTNAAVGGGNNPTPWIQTYP